MRGDTQQATREEEVPLAREIGQFHDDGGEIIAVRRWRKCPATEALAGNTPAVTLHRN
jgi:hypothetical protein